CASRLTLLDQLRLGWSNTIDCAAAADVVEVGVEETARCALTELAQHLEIFVVGLERAAGAERLVPPLHPDAGQPHPPEFARAHALRQSSLVDQLVDEGDAAQFREERGIETDFIDAGHDLACVRRDLAPLSRIDLYDQNVLGRGGAQKRSDDGIAAIAT